MVVVVKKRTPEGSFSNEKYPYFQYNIMILWYENAFRITGPLYGEHYLRASLMFSLLLVWTSSWSNIRVVGDDHVTSPSFFNWSIRNLQSFVSISLCGEPGVGVTKGPFVNLSATNFWQYKMICQNLHIMFIFSRCHRSVAAAKPVKFEHDI